MHIFWKQDQRHKLNLKSVSVLKIQIILVASLLKSDDQLCWASVFYLGVGLNEKKMQVLDI